MTKQVTSNLQREVEKLANRVYFTIVFLDKTTDDESIYVAVHPELDGCVAQGDTVEEARENLNLVRRDYILHLLEHNLPVPGPASVENAFIHILSSGSDDEMATSTVKIQHSNHLKYASLHS